MGTRLQLAVALSVIALAGCGTTTSPVPLASPASPLASATSTPLVASPPSKPPPTVGATSEPSPVASSPGPSPALATAFTTPVPPSADAAWTAIHWRKLASTDPLTLVRSVLRWRGGFIAVGSDGSSTPVWTSTDGAHWKPLLFNTATTFWPRLLIMGMAQVRGGLVALTMVGGGNCSGGLDCPAFSPPLMAWTSPDGRSWTANPGPFLGVPSLWDRAPHLAAGAAGLVAASSATPSVVATSADVINWRTLPAAALPAGVAIRDLVATTAGFTAVGTLPVDPDHDRAVALHSVDGATWTGPYALSMPTASAFILASTGPSWGADSLVVARNGLIAVGTFIATPGAALWWHSANGRDWLPLPTYAPLGPTTCTGEGCGNWPNGALVGDGHRMVALRGGADAGVWTSTDGLTWQRLPVTGDIPSEQAMNAVLMPSGVLLSDGTTTWIGEAGGR
jgi:hypothetical protein